MLDGRRIDAAVVVFAVILFVAGAAAKEVPYLSGRVNDLANMIPASTETKLETLLEKLEQDRGAQLAVLTIKSLEGDSLEAFSLRVAETWELGSAQFDDGALLLVAQRDRKMRLEVGYGLESVLTDAVARRILDEVMRPRFRAGDFDGGIYQGVLAVDGLLRGQDVATLLPSRARRGKQGELAGRLVMLGFASLIIGFFSVMAICIKGGQAWVMYFFLMPFWGVFPLALLGWWIGIVPIVIWIVVFPLFRILMRSWPGLETLVHESTSGWVKTSSSWSSGSGWSGGGGGGFSGGGGSFGGGGASSGW